MTDPLSLLRDQIKGDNRQLDSERRRFNRMLKLWAKGLDQQQGFASAIGPSMREDLITAGLNRLRSQQQLAIVRLGIPRGLQQLAMTMGNRPLGFDASSLYGSLGSIQASRDAARASKKAGTFGSIIGLGGGLLSGLLG